MGEEEKRKFEGIKVERWGERIWKEGGKWKQKEGENRKIFF